MGLIEAILLPTYGGYPAYLMAPAAFLQKPLRWLQAITRYRGTNSGGPNFAFDLCVRKITLEGRGELNLESWRVAYNGAEPIRWQTLEQFHRAFRDSGLQWRAFYPVYGLAEATLLVSSGGRDADPRAVSLGTEGLSEDRAVAPSAGDDASVQVPVCGPCSFETRVVIADPETCRPCAPGTVGEIWVQSPSVAQGYWNRPEATRATFQARLAGEEQSPFLRTGDLGFLDHGELVVTGRINDRIIVRGKKHYPQDIELTVESCSEAIRKGCVAAFGVDSPDGEAVCIAAELSRSAFRTPEAFGALLDTIRCAVTGHHEIPVQAVVLLAPGRIPKTSSGKLRRHDCRAMLGVRSGTAPTGAALEPVARWDRDVTAQRQIAC
jgi:acyl-CoA synthetase (AMP-forming)/AMP-acid ligase II